jgi:hypothetical protein
VHSADGAEAAFLAGELRSVAAAVDGLVPREWEGPAARVFERVLAELAADVRSAAALAEQ